MALYALDEGRPIYAAEAEERKTYQCAGCHSRVRVRRGPFRVPHYYHLAKAPSCRLYSKSEDHLLAQLAIQALLPPGEALIETPIPGIHRIADVFWEPQKIAFEIQCSLLTPYEVNKRVRDYETAECHVVWILDDRLYNKQKLRPAEALMRTHPSYYATLRRQTSPIFYDQFEVLFATHRAKKGQRLKVQLNQPKLLAPLTWKEDDFPVQVLSKTNPGTLYFRGDLIHLALLSKYVSGLYFSMQNLRALEILFKQNEKKEPTLFDRLLLKWVLQPFGLLMLNLLEWAERKG